MNVVINGSIALAFVFWLSNFTYAAPFRAQLYFTAENGLYLTAEGRTLHSDLTPSDQGRAIIRALLDGPQNGIGATLPDGTQLRAFFFDGDETAYVDFAGSIAELHKGGTTAELLTIFSVVNSLVLNIPEVKEVKLLTGGGEALTQAGHLDIRYPFKANLLLNR